MKIILLVTWIVSGQPPGSYQVEFDGWDKCTAARDAILQDRERIVDRMGLMPIGKPFPAVSAICTAE